MTMQQELVARNWRELIRPRQLDTDQDPTDRYGKFSCEPLERGFGTTLGNALRRVLLSSLQGAAVTSVRVTGVMHEFSTIPGVMEDVSHIILNLKEVRLNMHSEGPKVLRLRKTEPGEGNLVRMLDTNPVYDLEEFELGELKLVQIELSDGFVIEHGIKRNDFVCPDRWQIQVFGDRFDQFTRNPSAVLHLRSHQRLDQG